MCIGLFWLGAISIPSARICGMVKKGSSELEVQKAMLECGCPSPFENNLLSKDKPVTEDDRAFMFMCMRRSGVIFGNGRFDLCRQSHDLEVYRPKVGIPNRDINKRINGSFCHARSNWKVCQR
jgi:hypothetical protein